MEGSVRRWARFGSVFWLLLKRPLRRRRVQRPVLEYVDGAPLLVTPGVLNPVVFRSGEFLARAVASSSLAEPQRFDPAPRALDMGTGSGVGAIFAARRGYRVVGVDLNPEAVRCARVNVLLNRLEEQIEIRQGDLFAPVAGERFDLVLFNPPFFRGEPKDGFDLAWRSNEIAGRFAAGLPGALEPGGRALVVLSTDGDSDGILKTFQEHDLAVEPVTRRDFGNEVMTVYSVRRR